MENLFNGTYRGKKVLITGHTGFKGSWLSLWLNKLGAEVIGYSIGFPTEPNHLSLLSLNINSIIGDILDINKLEEVINQYQPDIIFHLAAQPLVRLSYEEPLLTLQTNIMGSANVLEIARKSGKIKAVINITSDKAYLNRETDVPYKETDPLGGRDPYSASKGCVEIVTNAYSESFFHPDDFGKKHNTLVASVRAGNVIGGGDWAKDRLIPDLVLAASGKKSFNIRYPEAIRPWQHVLEPLSGYLWLGANLLEGKKAFAGPWNFGPSHEVILKVEEAVKLSKKYWEDVSYTIDQNISHPHEAKILMLDSSKALKELKWKNVWDYNKTFEKTIGWYKNFYLNNLIKSEEDLDEYIADARRLNLNWL